MNSYYPTQVLLSVQLSSIALQLVWFLFAFCCHGFKEINVPTYNVLYNTLINLHYQLNDAISCFQMWMELLNRQVHEGFLKAMF